MTPTEATAEKFERAFESMPKQAKQYFLQRLITNNIYREDIIDMAIAQKRKKEEQKKFDYVAPIIILEGMKFFENHLLKGIQKV